MFPLKTLRLLKKKKNSQVTLYDEGKLGQKLKEEQEPGGRNFGRGHGRVLLTGLHSVTCSVFFLRAPRTNLPGVVSLIELVCFIPGLLATDAFICFFIAIFLTYLVWCD